jgi:hypothetical protein
VLDIQDSCLCFVVKPSAAGLIVTVNDSSDQRSQEEVTLERNLSFLDGSWCEWGSCHVGLALSVTQGYDHLADVVISGGLPNFGPSIIMTPVLAINWPG